MIYSVEKTARTVEEASALATSELNSTLDDVEVEVLEQGSRGLFGIIGNKLAKVRVTLKNSKGFLARDFLEEIFKKMKVDVGVEVLETEDEISLKVIGDDIAIVIGRRGETLDALQYITNLAVNKGVEKYKKVFIDVESYRLRRENALEKLANKVASKVIRTKKNVVLEPMNPYERKVIHAALQDNSLIRTYSIGKEPYRKIVVSLSGKQSKDDTSNK